MSSNPYETIPDAESGSVEYWFEGVVGERDVARVCSETWWKGLLIMLPAGAWLLWRVFFSARPVGGWFSVTIWTVFGVWFLFRAYRYLTWTGMLIRMSPRLLGHVRGRVNSDFLELESHGIKDLVPVEIVRWDHSRKRHIGIILETYRLLPAELFNDFQGALNVVAEARARSRPVVLFDFRATQPAAEPPRDVPAGAIGVAGTVVSRDMLPETWAIAIRGHVREILINLTWLTLVVAWVYDLFGIGLAAIVGALLIVLVYGKYLWAHLVGIRTVRRFARSPDEPVAVLDGWLSNDGVDLQSGLGHRFYEWFAFVGYAIDEDRMRLKLPGEFNYLTLSKRLFASEVEWNAAGGLVAQKLPAIELTDSRND
jgi:hypothetical protein